MMMSALVVVVVVAVEWKLVGNNERVKIDFFFHHACVRKNVSSSLCMHYHRVKYKYTDLT